MSKPPAKKTKAPKSPEPPKGPGPVDFVTVVFVDELPLLEIQAHSMARFVPPEMVGAIIIYINESDPSACYERINTVIKPLYGPHADKVVVRDVGQISDYDSKIGWLAQQGCKLDAAKLAQSEYYLVLDAKHQIVAPLLRAHLFDDEGHPHKPMVTPRADQLPWLEDSLVYFGLDVELAQKPSAASAPPFMMHAATVSKMVDEIVAREGRDIVEFFSTKTDRTTEFTLYFAYLLKLGTAGDHLVPGKNNLVALRIGTTPERREALKRQLSSSSSFWCFSVHRKHLANLPETDRELILDVWTRHALYDSRKQAAAVLAKLEKHFKNLLEIERERFEIARLHRKQLKPRTAS